MNNENESQKIKAKNIKVKLLWFLGIVLICTGLISFVSSVILGLSFIIIGAVLIPPVNNFLRRKSRQPNDKNTKDVCPHCKEEINIAAVRCPHCHGKIYRWTMSRKIAVGIIIAGVLVVVVAVNDSSSNSTSSTSVSTTKTTVDDRKTISIVYAEEVIKNILKSPSTADFSNVKAYELSNQKDVWAVNGYVDSQNSFSAMIRSVWEVQLDYRDGKGGSVKSILFNGEKLQ
ncbi:hypothetical protein IT397_02745 [Candidatus Nomurabacteria bacterium]|nr:hypothetical protein [Candidatus Nomurabacteria bacterium]